MPDLLWEPRDDGVAWLTLNRPATGNALTAAQRESLIAHLAEASAGAIFSRRGLVVDAAGAYLLTRLIGPQRAKELIFFADDLPAAEAARLGLVNRVVPADKLVATAADWASRLAAGPMVALGLGKRLVNHALDTDRAGCLGEVALAAEVNMSSEDGQEGLRAFLERRVPRFQGW